MADVVRAGTSSLRVKMLDGGVLLLEMSGLLTAKALAEFAAKAAHAYGCEAVGFVLDYRRGSILATSDELGRLIDRIEPGSPIARPGAFVTTPANVDLMMDHAERMAWRGIWRRVFSDLPTAATWVRAKASSPSLGPRKSSA